MDSTTTGTPPRGVLDFNDRRVSEGDSALLVRLPWDGPAGRVQELDLLGRLYVTFELAPELDGWYPAKEVC